MSLSQGYTFCFTDLSEGGTRLCVAHTILQKNYSAKSYDSVAGSCCKSGQVCMQEFLT